MCSPELSDFETAIWHTFSQDSVIVIGVTAVNQNQINQFVDETGITYPILKDQSSGGNGPGGFGGVIYDEYYIPNQGSPYPRDFIIDQSGVLVYANNEIDTEYMIYIIEDLMVEQELNAREENFLPKRVEIFPVFPNPFNSVATVTFSIENQNNTLLGLNVYTLEGRLVEALARKIFQPGNHKISWHASQYASGLYIISIESELGIQSQKIILLK